MKAFAAASIAFLAAVFAGAEAASSLHAPAAVDAGVTRARVALGRRLFYDADLSIDGTMACSTCHEQRHGFADGNRTHAGVHGDAGRHNVPGLANVAEMKSLTWGDPRMRTLEAQVLIPLFGGQPVEMGMAKGTSELKRRFGRDACYRRLFRQAFPLTRGRIDIDAVSASLAAFQRTFVSRDAPLDRGEVAPASARAFGRSCASCHAGPDATDGSFHRIAVSDAADRGLAEVTGRPDDDGAFRTPSLRNVAVTGPYLHDGRAVTLEEAINAHLLGLSTSEMAAIVNYLQAMTDAEFLSRADLAYPNNPCG